MLQVEIELLFLLGLFHRNVKFIVKFLHQANVVHWVSYIRPVNLDQEFMALSITYPFKKSLVPLCFYFLWIIGVYLRSILCLENILGGLVDVVGHHHLVNHHVLQSSPFLGCIRLNHLLLYNQLLLSW